MPITVIFGGQYGSEGKGKTANFLAKKLNAKAVVRVGGPNSGHTIIDQKGNPLIFKHLPTSSVCKGIKSVLTAGHYINLDILQKEILITNTTKDDLLINPFAVIITKSDVESEQNGCLLESIASTGSGLGSAIIKRVKRENNVMFAKDIEALKPYIGNTTFYLRKLLDEGERIIIEGTQGFGLSLLHSELYPFCTSRDTSAAAFVSEAGLSPLDVDDVVMVIRSFPIRVGGNSGLLKNETSWSEISNIAQKEVIEYTSVTKKIRRVAYFDEEIVKKSILYNKPTTIVINHMDYLGFSRLEDVKKYTEELSKKIGCKINYLGIDRENLITV